jgi:hypothetical protein
MEATLEKMREQARILKDLAGAGVAGALDLVAAHHPDGAHAVSQSDAKLVVARHYGFAAWADLEQYFQLLETYSRAPDEVEGGGSIADEFLALACLRAGDDSPERWHRAAELLASNPGIVNGHIHVAAACAASEVVESMLAADPSLANAQGGPYGWEPILYLANARHDPTVTAEATLATAASLLAHGADPNAGYLWHGLLPPFTAVTCALSGGGEGGEGYHPHRFALARALLAAGADGNDGQALYNCQFGDDDTHLEMLFDFGLGKGDGGIWRQRFPVCQDSPAEMLRGQLSWAILHDMRARTELLVDNGADFLTPFEGHLDRPAGFQTSAGRTPAEVAALAGCPDLVEYLVSKGAAPPRGEGPDGLIAAVLRGDAVEAERLRIYTEAARRERPGLCVWAAARRLWDAIPVLVGLGWDVNALARGDVPIEQEWQTALHEAAAAGDLEAARMLLDLGADPDIEDGRFRSTPLGWAEHFEQPAMMELLRPLTAS